MRLVGAALVALSALALAAVRGPAAPPLPTFTDVAPSAGIRFKHLNGSPEKNYIFEAKGGGVCLLDYDGDGLLDIYFVNGNTLEDIQRGVTHSSALYRANGDGTYTDVTQEARVPGPLWGMGCAVGDYDNDGWPDLYVLGINGNVLYHNDGSGRFTDVTRKAGLEGCNYRGTRVMCGPGGIPGALDSLYHNDGDGTFTDVTVAAGVLEPVARYGLGVAVGDYDNDGWPDVYVANDSTPSYLYRNKGNGTFEEGALLAGVAVSDDGMEQAGMGTDFGDYDNDGWLDITKSNFSFQYTNLYHNEHDGRFVDRAASAGIAVPTYSLVKWGTKFLDYDNDGWKDILVANGHVYPYLRKSAPGGETYDQPRLLFRNLGNGKFADVSRESGPGILDARCSRGLAVGDLDDDGDLDVVIVNIDDTPSILRNDGGSARSWLTVALRGTKSNRMGLGARVTATTGDLRQIAEATTAGSIYSASDSRVHFGLGRATQADLEIRWPSGKVQTLRAVRANQIVVVDEDEGLVPARPRS
jgi:hypothetical protein